MRRHRFSPSLSWDSLAWLRDAWSGPLVLKGLMDARQAGRAVAAGYDAVVVSNHGGRQLDGAASTIEVLPNFVSEIGGRVPILIDSGFSSGIDVVKALAMGASAVQIGRSFVYALATAGESGVAKAIDLFRSEIDNAMALCGATSV